MRIGSLFSGIGGLELGLERAIPGARVVWQVEIDPFCRRVLAKHWPGVPRFEDIRTVGGDTLAPADLICGGFPCQDVSSAGKRAGLAGAKSGLWRDYARIVAEMRPRFVVVENVASGKKIWLPTVRQDLEALGYRARAFALSAADVGAPHLRRRVFVVATTDADGIVLREQQGRRGGSEGPLSLFPGEGGLSLSLRYTDDESEPVVAEHAEASGLPGVAGRAPHWSAAPELRGMAHGIPCRLDRCRALGNAVVPQCAEVIGRLIVEHVGKSKTDLFGCVGRLNYCPGSASY